MTKTNKPLINKRQIIRAFKEYRGNMRAVARYLGVDVQYIRYEMEQDYEIRDVRDDELRKVQEGFYE